MQAIQENKYSVPQALIRGWWKKLH